MKTLLIVLFGITVSSVGFCDDYPQESLADQYEKQEASRKPQSKPSECENVDWDEINAMIEANKNPICKDVNKPGHVMQVDEVDAGCNFTSKVEALKKKCRK